MALAVDDKYVFWWQNLFFMRGGITADISPSVLIRCGDCEADDLEADGKYVYGLAGTIIRRFDREDASMTEIPLWGGHGNVGTLASDDTYLYTAMHGCAGLARYDKATLEQVGDVMYVAGVTYPHSGGATLLAILGERVVCAAPDNPIFVFDSWGAPVRTLHQAAGYRGLALLDDDIYWSEFIGRDAHLATIPFSGGDVRTFAHPREANVRIIALQEPERVLVPIASGFARFDTEGKQFLSNFPSGRPFRLTKTKDAVFATMGKGYWVGDGTVSTGYYIARIPIDAFE